MKRDISVYLEDIIVSLQKIKQYTKGLSEQDFYQNIQVQDAILRRLEVIGEATNHLPESFRNEHPQIPWRKISGMRNVLIHEYFGVNLHRVWLTVAKDLPLFQRQLSKVVPNEKAA